MWHGSVTFPSWKQFICRLAADYSHFTCKSCTANMNVSEYFMHSDSVKVTFACEDDWWCVMEHVESVICQLWETQEVKWGIRCGVGLWYGVWKSSYKVWNRSKTPRIRQWTLLLHPMQLVKTNSEAKDILRNIVYSCEDIQTRLNICCVYTDKENVGGKFFLFQQI